MSADPAYRWLLAICIGVGGGVVMDVLCAVVIPYIPDRLSGVFAASAVNAASLLPTVFLLWRTRTPLLPGIFALALACLLYADSVYRIINWMEHPPHFWSLYPWQALCVVSCVWLGVWLLRRQPADEMPSATGKKRRDPPVVTITFAGTVLLTLLGGCTAMVISYPASICNEALRQEQFVRRNLRVGMSRSDLYTLQKTALAQKNGVMFVTILGVESPLNGPDQTGELPEPTSAHPTPEVRLTFAETTDDGLIVQFDWSDHITRWKSSREAFDKSGSYCAEVGHKSG